MDVVQTERASEIAKRVEEFVRTVVVPYERDPRCGSHGPSEELVRELRSKARAAGVLTPHILPGGDHLTQLETATVLKRSGLSPLPKRSPTSLTSREPPDMKWRFCTDREKTPAPILRSLPKNGLAVDMFQ